MFRRFDYHLATGWPRRITKRGMYLASLARRSRRALFTRWNCDPVRIRCKVHRAHYDPSSSLMDRRHGTDQKDKRYIQCEGHKTRIDNCPLAQPARHKNFYNPVERPGFFMRIEWGSLFPAGTSLLPRAVRGEGRCFGGLPRRTTSRLGPIVKGASADSGPSRREKAVNEGATRGFHAGAWKGNDPGDSRRASWAAGGKDARPGYATGAGPTNTAGEDGASRCRWAPYPFSQTPVRARSRLHRRLVEARSRIRHGQVTGRRLTAGRRPRGRPVQPLPHRVGVVTAPRSAAGRCARGARSHPSAPSRSLAVMRCHGMLGLPAPAHARTKTRRPRDLRLARQG